MIIDIVQRVLAPISKGLASGDAAPTNGDTAKEFAGLMMAEDDSRPYEYPKEEGGEGISLPASDGQTVTLPVLAGIVPDPRNAAFAHGDLKAKVTAPAAPIGDQLDGVGTGISAVTLDGPVDKAMMIPAANVPDGVGETEQRAVETGALDVPTKGDLMPHFDPIAPKAVASHTTAALHPAAPQIGATSNLFIPDSVKLSESLHHSDQALEQLAVNSAKDAVPHSAQTLAPQPMDAASTGTAAPAQIAANTHVGFDAAALSARTRPVAENRAQADALPAGASSPQPPAAPFATVIANGPMIAVLGAKVPSNLGGVDERGFGPISSDLGAVDLRSAAPPLTAAPAALGAQSAIAMAWLAQAGGVTAGGAAASPAAGPLAWLQEAVAPLGEPAPLGANLGEGGWPALGPSSAGGPASAAPVMGTSAASASHISAQLLPLAQMAQGGPVELTLSPAELGGLRFEMHQRGDQLTIVLSAERPDTADLLRRNSDQLLQDFKNAGFSGASLSFGDWGSRGQNAPPPHFEQSGDTAANTAPQTPAPQAFAAPLPWADSSRSLNLRL